MLDTENAATLVNYMGWCGVLERAMKRAPWHVSLINTVLDERERRYPQLQITQHYAWRHSL